MGDGDLRDEHSLFESVLLMYELPADEAELLVRECSDAATAGCASSTADDVANWGV